MPQIQVGSRKNMGKEMTEIKCRYIEEEKLVAVEFTLWDGTTRHLVLPPTEQGKELAQEIVGILNSTKDSTTMFSITYRIAQEDLGKIRGEDGPTETNKKP